MDRFSELVAKGVAKFEYQPVAPEIPVVCPVCRTYNNIFGAVTDTHMSPMPDGTKVITGHMITDKAKFDQFLWMPMYMGGNFILSGYHCFADFMAQARLKGRYEIMNGDVVYVLSEGDTGEKGGHVAALPTGMSFTTQHESVIPQNSRFLTNTGMSSDVKECLVGTPDEAAQRLNESRYVAGTNWVPVYMSEGVRFVCRINNQNYLLS